MAKKARKTRKGFKRGECNVYCQTMKASRGRCTVAARKRALKLVKMGAAPASAVAKACRGR